jgi:putative intracellular protease/amidase
MCTSERRNSLFFLLGLLVALTVAGTARVNAGEPGSIPAYHSRVGHSRPVIAIVGANVGAETTDYLVPYGVLTQSGVAEVVALGTEPGAIQMMPALKIVPQATVDEFDTRFPEGADYVVVPAQHNPNDATLIKWIQVQAGKGATTVGICDGVWVLANAGLLRGHRATGHWYSLDDLEHKFPDTTWIRNRRYVVDGSIITTTGVTASIPVSLALIEAIAGREPATEIASEIGAADWSSAHDSGKFKLGTRSMVTAAGNELAFWSHEKVGIPVSAGVNEIALALVADAYSRTYRSEALTVSSAKSLRTRGGLTLIPDLDDAKAPAHMLAPVDSKPPVQELNLALSGISEAYGAPTAAFVALQIEYPQNADHVDSLARSNR